MIGEWNVHALKNPLDKRSTTSKRINFTDPSSPLEGRNSVAALRAPEIPSRQSCVGPHTFTRDRNFERRRCPSSRSSSRANATDCNARCNIVSTIEGEREGVMEARMDIELHNHNRDFQASASMRRTADLVNFRAIGIRNERISYFSSCPDSLIQLSSTYACTCTFNTCTFYMWILVLRKK